MTYACCCAAYIFSHGAEVKLLICANYISKSSDRARAAFYSPEHALSFSSVRYSFRDLSINAKCCHWRLIRSWRMGINFLEGTIGIEAGIFEVSPALLQESSDETFRFDILFL